MVYNLFQARLYSLDDRIAVEQVFSEQDSAQSYILACFFDARDGLLYSRGVIRAIDSQQGAWRCLWVGGNPKAVLLDPGTADIDGWRLSYYDERDVRIETFAVKAVSEQKIEAGLIELNAVYAVLSGREAKGPRDHDWICSLYLNPADF